MSFELCYASAPRGIRPGSSGFCTVAQTRGIPAALVDLLESLSFYTPLYPPGHPQVANNPVNFAHWRATAGGQNYNILSRICFTIPAHTQRLSVFAHHIALPSADLVPGGPVAVLGAIGLMRQTWPGPPTEIDQPPALPRGEAIAKPANLWATTAGDAGWAGAVAQAAIDPSPKPVYIIYPPAMDMLALMGEVVALIPTRQRWLVTFNTYFTQTRAEAPCLVRCCIAGSPAAGEAARAGGLLIDLTKKLSTPPPGKLVDAARYGPSPEPQPAAASVKELNLLEDTTQGELSFADEAIAPVVSPKAGSKTAAAPIRAPVRKSPSIPVPVVTDRPGPVEPVYGRSNPSPAPAGVSALYAFGIAAVVGLAGYGGGYFYAQTVAEKVTQTAVAKAIKNTDDNATVKINALTTEKEAQQDRADKAERAANQKYIDGQQHPDTSKWQLIPAKVITDDDVKQQIEAAKNQQREEDRKTFAAANPTTTNPTPVAPVNVLVPRADPLKTEKGIPAKIFSIQGIPPTREARDIPILTLGDAAETTQLALMSPDPKGDGYCSISGGGTRCTINRPNLAEKGSIELGTISISGNSVVLHLSRISDADDDKARRSFLETCLLKIVSPSGESMIQFVDPDQLPFVMTQKTLEIKSIPANLKGLMLECTPIQIKDSPWEFQTQARGDVPKLSFRNTQVTGVPTIFLSLTDRKIDSDYAGKMSNARDELKANQTDFATWSAGLPMKKDVSGQTTELDTDALKNDKVAKVLDGLFKEKNNAIETRQRTVNALENFPTLTILVKLSNNVTMARVVASPK